MPRVGLRARSRDPRRVGTVGAVTVSKRLQESKIDFAVANLADFWGEPIEALLPPLTGKHHVLRQHANYITSRHRTGGD